MRQHWKNMTHINVECRPRACSLFNASTRHVTQNWHFGAPWRNVTSQERGVPDELLRENILMRCDMWTWLLLFFLFLLDWLKSIACAQALGVDDIDVESVLCHKTHHFVAVGLHLTTCHFYRACAYPEIENLTSTLTVQLMRFSLFSSCMMVL